MSHRNIDTQSQDSGVQYSGTGGDVFDDETRLKRGFGAETSSATSDSTHHSIYFQGKKVPYIPQLNLNDSHHRTGNPRNAGASGQQKSDASTTDPEGLIDVLQKHLIGSRRKKKKDDVIPIIHIGKVVINPPPKQTGIYGEPIYNFYPQQETFKPPDPCVPSQSYMSVPDYIGSQNTGTVPTPHVERHPVEQGMSAPPSTTPLTAHPVEPDRELLGYHDDDEVERSNGMGFSLGLTSRATAENSNTGASTTIKDDNSDSLGSYARMRNNTQRNILYQSTPVLHQGGLAEGLQLRISPSDVNVDKFPEQVDVRLLHPGTDREIYQGQLTCAVLKPNEGSGRQPRPRSQDVGYSANPPASHRSISPPYENFNSPFTGREPFRIGDADDITASAPAMMHVPQRMPSSTKRPTGHLWTTSQSVHDLTQSSGASHTPNPPRSPGVRGPVPSARGPVPSARGPLPRGRSKVTCKDFGCLGDGYYDVNDENELSRIRECIQISGKTGQWVVTPLEDHPLYTYCLYAKLGDRACHFPIMFTKKQKFKIDPERKGFKCICKMIMHYQTNYLPGDPHRKYNLSHECFPKGNIPNYMAYTESSDEMKDQYAGVVPQQTIVSDDSDIPRQKIVRSSEEVPTLQKIVPDTRDDVKTVFTTQF